jgi:FAD/FMN-containing dehydrogenase
MRYDIEGLIAALPEVPLLSDAARVKNKSRDFYWYSPILRDALEDVRADLVVLPESEAQVAATLAACHARGIPVTPRGAGTGNYGQAMPMAGGVVLDLSALTAIRFIRRGSARAQSGVRLLDLDEAARAAAAQEQRMHPSTLRNATLGGFVCGGSGGVGSVTWGGLRDRGNVLGARVLTMEAEPRILELRGDDVQKVIHAYGTTGVVTEVEIALVQAADWIDAAVAFDTFETAAQFGHALACQDALLKKLVTVLAAPIPQTFLRLLGARAGEGAHLVLTMIARESFEAFEAMLRAWRARLVHARAPEATDGLLPIYEYAWNHTTLHALKVDRTITYHQTLHPAPDSVRTAVELHRRFGDEVLQHLEFVRFDGTVACYGLPLIRFTTAERLHEIETIYEAAGCPTFSPHTVTLEDGGMKRVDPVQLAFKRETDPRGLLNPGKMRAFDEPDYAPATRSIHLFAGGEAARPLPGRGGAT